MPDRSVGEFTWLNRARKWQPSGDAQLSPLRTVAPSVLTQTIQGAQLAGLRLAVLSLVAVHRPKTHWPAQKTSSPARALQDPLAPLAALMLLSRRLLNFLHGCPRLDDCDVLTKSHVMHTNQQVQCQTNLQMALLYCGQNRNESRIILVPATCACANRKGRDLTASSSTLYV
eukprot:COSAG02_NODE_6528_length_3518_cov_5.108219_3_plen_172_part_00